MAVLGLCCCSWTFSSCREQGLLFIAVRGLLIAVASLVAEHRLQMCRLQQLWHVGLVAPQHVGSSRAKDRTHVPCIGRRILNHCATREVRHRILGQHSFPLKTLQIHTSLLLSKPSESKLHTSNPFTPKYGVCYLRTRIVSYTYIHINLLTFSLSSKNMSPTGARTTSFLVPAISSGARIVPVN